MAIDLSKFEHLNATANYPVIEALYLLYSLFGHADFSVEAVRDFTHHHLTFDSARRDLLRSKDFENVYRSLSKTNVREICYTPAENIDRSWSRADGMNLCIATITKNASRHIVEMINSVAPIADSFVVLDTGSEDSTCQLAADVLTSHGISYVAESVNFIDFAQARNAALSLVPPKTDWIFMLDADERIAPEDYAAIRGLMRASKDCWRLPRYNFLEPTGLGAVRPYPDFQSRLFRHIPENPIRYVGAVHEGVTNVSTWGTAPINTTVVGGSAGGPHIHHLGPATIDLDDMIAKERLYERLTILA